MSSRNSRANILRIALNAEHSVALHKITAELEISWAYAGELVFNAGLWALKDISKLKEEDYKYFDEKYRRKEIEVRDERREQLERKISKIDKKEAGLREQLASVQQQRQNQEQEQTVRDNSHFKTVLEEWENRPLEWKLKTLKYAKKFPENQFARQVVALAEDNAIYEGGNY